jgi:hypothetical protein
MFRRNRLDVVRVGAQAKQLKRPSPLQRKNQTEQAAAPLKDRHFGNRHHKFGAPAANVSELTQDLVFKVPR